MACFYRMTMMALCISLAVGARGADWPQWRGPERSGIGRETGLIQAWPAGGPQALWEAPGGAGYASVAVAGGRVYLPIQDKAGQHLLALEEATGKKLWQTTIGPVFMASRYPGARATPTVEGEFVYVTESAGGVACLKAANGEVVWKLNFLEETGKQNLLWGFASAPFVSGDLLVIGTGIKDNYQTPAGGDLPPKAEGDSVWAIDKKTGKVVWKSLTDQASYSTPMEFTSGGVEQFVLLTRNNVVGLARADGRLLWRHPYIFGEKNTNVATPIIAGDLIWVGSAYQTGSMVLQVDTAKTPAVREVWKSKTLQAHFCTPILLDGYLYGYDDNKLVCVELKTGKPMWSDDTILKGQMVYADGLFYIWGERGVLGLGRLSPQKCEILGTAKLSPGTLRWGNPVVANGRLYIRDDQKLWCFDVKASR